MGGQNQHYRYKQSNFKGPYNLSFDYNKFRSSFGDNKILFLKKYIKQLNFKYRNLNFSEKKIVYKKINNFLNLKPIKSGPKRKKIWQKGWNEILNNFKKKPTLNNLIPHYYKRNKRVIRFQGKFIVPEDHKFEYKFGKIILRYLSNKYFEKFKNIYEFGCGPSQNILYLAKINKKPKNFYGYDWVDTSQKIIQLIEKNKINLNVERHKFFSQKIDMFSKIKKLNIKNNSACLTFVSMEQLGSNFKNFYNFLFKSKFDIIINIEPINELYSSTEFDKQALKYHTKRAYLKDYLTYLRKQENKKKIKILKIKKIIGGETDDCWTLLIWKKII